MKNLILILFAIVSLGLAVNAQDLSFKTFNQIVKPEGELVATEDFGDRVDYFYQKWDEFSITTSQFMYSPGEKSVFDVRKQTVFYDELDFDNLSTNQSGAVHNVKIYTKDEQRVVLSVQFAQKDKYTKSINKDVTFTLKNKQDADNFVKKLKEKAFDMSLALDAKVERVSLQGDMVYDAENPDGISSDEYESSKNSQSSNSSDDNSEPTKSISFVSVTLKHTGGERYYLIISGEENEKCSNAVYSFTHSKYGEETRNYTFCEGQKLIEKNTGRLIFTATKAMHGTTYKIN